MWMSLAKSTSGRSGVCAAFGLPAGLHCCDQAQDVVLLPSMFFISCQTVASSLKLHSCISAECSPHSVSKVQRDSASHGSSPCFGGCRDIWYEERGPVGILHFPFYNGAASTEQLHRLHGAFTYAKSKSNTSVIILAGGRYCWNNGIHLNVIEASSDPGVEVILMPSTAKES